MLIGVDVNRQILFSLPKDEFHPVTADGLHLPFCDNSFPLVISSQVTEHIERDRQDAFFGELLRVTEQGGNVVIATMNANFPYYVKGHKSHVAEFDLNAANGFVEKCSKVCDIELYVVVPSGRCIRAQAKRAKM